MIKKLMGLVLSVGLVVGLAAPAMAWTPGTGIGYIVSLGDSRASGYGLYPLASGFKEDAACWRSTKAAVNYMTYPANMRTIKNNFACSGAQAAHLRLPQAASELGQNVTVPAQINHLSNRLYANGKTTVTLQFGPNDVKWGLWLGKCFQETCGTAEDTAQFDALLAGYKQNLRLGLAALKAHPLKPQILVGGAYDPFINPYVAQAYIPYGLTTEEYNWAANAVAKLNNVTRAAATEYGVTYVPIVFTSPAELQQPTEVPVGVTPFHPTELGQRTTASAFMAAMK